MLLKLFGSQARVKILKVFLMNPEKQFFMRQLARDLDLQINSVRRELDNLEKFGLLSTELAKDDPLEGDEPLDAKGKKIKGLKEKKYYQVNFGFPLYEEIKALIVKSHVLYKPEFIDDIKKTGDIKVLILSGVFVNNKNAPVDILIVGEINRQKFARILENYQKELGKEINYTCMNEKEFKYRKSMTDVFLYDVLEGDRMIIINSEGLI
ncbi:MAG: hypothetical protein NT091_02705 [Candidatus Falkowbacteria bacterium]|nr:hypothetical protein [Candidatus Falkowbacteria bacterium]